MLINFNSKEKNWFIFVFNLLETYKTYLVKTFFHSCFIQGSDDEDEGMKAPLPPDRPMPPPLPPTPDQVIIRKDYDPKGNSLSQIW